MTVPTNLFIDSPEVEDAALTPLSKTPDEWPEEIVSRVKERVPSSAGMALMVKFMKKDDETGTAVGSVIISSAEKSVVVPVIVKDFNLSPVDIMLASGKVLPLTLDYFNAVMQKDGAFDRLDDFPAFAGIGRFEQNSLWNAAYPPTTGRYAYASGGYPILEQIASTIDGAEFKAFLLKQANEATAAKLLTGPHKDIVTKLAELKPLKSNSDLIKSAADNVIRPIIVMKKEAANRYTVFANSDKTFNPAIVTCDRASAAEFVSAFTSKPDAFIDGLETMGERLLFAPKDHGEHVLAKPEKDEPVSCDLGCYNVKTPDNVSVVGHVFPKVVDFDMKPLDMKVFVGKGKGAIQKDIWGTRAVSKEELRYDCPATGATGVFVYSAHGDDPVCTTPVKISMIVADPQVLTLKVEDLMGRPLTIKVSKGKDSLHRIAKLGDGEYLLPGSRVRWVATGDLIQVTGSKEDYMTKVAGERLTTDPISVIPTGYGQYSVKGLDKYAGALGWDKTNLGRAETMFLLASVGCSGATITEALEKTSASRIHSYTERPRLVAEKVAMARPLAHILVKKAKDIKANLVKEAAYMENAQTVDALLSLNFVTPDNLSKFVSKIPAFKAVVSHLASCLLAARIGVKEIPEQAASTAMHRLLDVISGLESIKASQSLGAGQ